MKLPRTSKNVLRARGYMTTDEFVDIFTKGLREYMKNSWHDNSKLNGDDKLSHPVDLVNSASIYIDVMYNVVDTFGVQPIKEEDKDI